jgi:ribosomal protein S6--L-glutamate ligase
LRIAILNRNHNAYSHKRLFEAGKERGHDMVMIDTLQCYIKISAQSSCIHYRGSGEILSNIDAIIPRIGSSITLYGTAIVRQFETMGIYTLNSALAIARSRDKLRSLQTLAKRKINMPITGFAKSRADTKDLIKIVGGAPLIIKLLQGTQGMGVVIADTNKAAESVINAFNCVNAEILVQEFISEANGSDIRCFVVGDKVIASMKREASEGEFRSNIHCGGKGSLVKITPEERNMAVKAAKVLGLNLAGVDIIRSNRGPMVLEVNSSPGLEGIEKVTGKDIAVEIIKFIEKDLVKKKS